MFYHLRSPPEPTQASRTTFPRLTLSDAVMRDQARQWHLRHPEFVLDALKANGHCGEPAMTEQALHYLAEAAAIGFWSRRDMVQYPLACLLAGGSLITVGSFRQFLEHFTEADRDIVQRFIDAAPVHYWTYIRGKIRPFNESTRT